MCGIAGIVGLKANISQEDKSRLELALGAQAHRGPDSKASWSDHRVAFGHNRLSIIDLSSAANQPFYREDLALTIIFNGEIYNYQELKFGLSSKGYTFSTSSDTEVLLVAYREYGHNLTQYLVGMFAFVIYDHENEHVFSARDRFGEKPFFYIQTENSFYFASELNALRKLYPGILTINQEAVVDLMENMYINLHHTIYKEVKVFQPANQLSVEGSKLSWSSYYSFPKFAQHSPGFDSLKREAKEKLFEIVTNELHADVPVATFLSSGIDSSVITAIAKEIKPDILAITMSTGDSHTDEVESASLFAKKLGIRQEIVKVNPGSLAVLGKLLKNIQPLADASLIPTHLVTEAVTSHTKVMLSGDAGDEVFGSYNKPNLYKAYGRKQFPLGSNLLAGMMLLPDSLWEKYLSDKNRISLGGWKGFYQKTNINSTFDQIFRKGSPLNAVKGIAESLMNDYHENPEKLSFGVDILSRLPGDFLFKVDSASMLSSLEVRAPFLDHRLIDLSLGSDLDSLMPNRIDKEITKSIYKDFVGEAHQGSKKGFSIPYMIYLQGEWGELLEKFLREGLSAEHFNLNTEGLLGLLSELRKSSRQLLARVLFSVLVLEIWLRVFHLEQELEFSFDRK